MRGREANEGPHFHRHVHAGYRYGGDCPARPAGDDGVDFNVYDFCGENGPMQRADWREWVRGVRRCPEDGGLAVGQAHAVLGVFAPDDVTFRPALCREVLTAGTRKVVEAFVAG